MKNIKVFEEFEYKDKMYSPVEVVLLILDAMVIAIGDEWIPEEDENFKNWLKSNGLLETFEKISK